MNTMHIAYVAFGSNKGDRLETFNRAAKAISLLPDTEIMAVSSVYETEPVGFAEQDLFLNAAVKIKTGLSPHALLGALLGIEAAMGRVRQMKNGPRILDLDLLLYDAVQITSEELTLPHPRMSERAFVLCPLCDIFPTYRDKLKKISRSGVKKTGLSIQGGAL